MDQRYKIVLYGLIEEYVRTAHPVGSGSLVASLRLSLSSATIRNILRELEEEGYLHQPHTSAGRVPTDKGYRLYVNDIVVRRTARRRAERQVQKLLQARGEHKQPARVVAKALSQLAQSIAVSGWLNSRNAYGAGLTMLLKQPEAESREAVREVSVLLDDVDSHMEAFASEESPEVRVYIGSENPAFQAEHISIAVRQVTCPNGEKVILLIAGPKRMPYKRHVSLLQSMASVIEEL